ncbi:RHS repeat domain-containing protein [Streptomyces mirabilis]|uniref:RHS repeat domain-containing protein n=1 Tax=Streptomyces mirabilis TaxID=68239 RepID=UPI003D9DE14D
MREESADGRGTTYFHDNLGRRTGRRTPSGAATTWSYDAAGRRTGMLVSGWAIDFAYGEAGCRTGHPHLGPPGLGGRYEGN